MASQSYSVTEIFLISNSAYKFTGITLFETKKQKTRREIIKQWLKFMYYILWVVNMIINIILLVLLEIFRSDQKNGKNNPYICSNIFTVIKSSMIYSKRNTICDLIGEIDLILKGRKIEGSKIADLLKYIKIFKFFCKMAVFGYVMVYFHSFSIVGLNAIKKFMWIPSDNTMLLVLANLWVHYTATTAAYMIFTDEISVLIIIKLFALSFDSLNNDVTSLNDFPKRERMNEFKEIVKKHLKLIELCKKLEQSLWPMFYIHFLQNSSVICSIGSLIINSDDSGEKIILATFILQELCQILAICHFGQKIINASLNIRNSLFECDWYEPERHKGSVWLPSGYLAALP
jgi:hypothetical protein